MPSTPRLLVRIAALGLGLGACNGRPSVGAACLPPARADGSFEEVTVQVSDGPYAMSWYCEGPPPTELLDGSHRLESIWVEGEECDPCDLEKIAALAATQVCDAEGPPALRLLCGPIPHEGEPWERKGCVYAVASNLGCVY